MIATLHDTSYTAGILHVEFFAAESPSSCHVGSARTVCHETNITNIAWGVYPKLVRLTYWTDSRDVRVCSAVAAAQCEAAGAALTVTIPEVPQAYWAGEHKKVLVNVCLNPGAADCNLSYRVEAEIDSRDLDILQLAPVTLQSNCYITTRN